MNKKGGFESGRSLMYILFFLFLLRLATPFLFRSFISPETDLTHSYPSISNPSGPIDYIKGLISFSLDHWELYSFMNKLLFVTVTIPLGLTIFYYIRGFI